MSTNKTTGQQPGGRMFRRRAAEEVENEQEQEELEEESSVNQTAVTPKKDRPTPSRRKEEDADEDNGNIVTRTVGSIREYLTGVRSEIDKVAWPTRADAQRLTTIVLISLLVSSAALGLIAYLFTQLFTIGLDTPILLFGVMFVAVAGGLIFNRVYSRRSSSL